MSLHAFAYMCVFVDIYSNHVYVMTSSVQCTNFICANFIDLEIAFMVSCSVSEDNRKIPKSTERWKAIPVDTSSSPLVLYSSESGRSQWSIAKYMENDMRASLFNDQLEHSDSSLASLVCETKADCSCARERSMEYLSFLWDIRALLNVHVLLMRQAEILRNNYNNITNI